MRSHELAVCRLLEAWPDAHRYRFARAVRDALDAGKEFQSPGIIPDLFLIDRPNRNVVAFEVEDTSNLTSGKVDRYCGYWWGVEGMGWNLVLVVVYIDGRPSVAYDVGDLAIERLALSSG